MANAAPLRLPDIGIVGGLRVAFGDDPAYVKTRPTIWGLSGRYRRDHVRVEDQLRDRQCSRSGSRSRKARRTSRSGVARRSDGRSGGAGGGNHGRCQGGAFTWAATPLYHSVAGNVGRGLDDGRPTGLALRWRLLLLRLLVAPLSLEHLAAEPAVVDYSTGRGGGGGLLRLREVIVRAAGGGGGRWLQRRLPWLLLLPLLLLLLPLLR